MSADNWTQCPKCQVLKLKQDGIAMPSNKWLEQSIAVDQLIDTSVGHSLREDYHIGILDGMFHIAESVDLRLRVKGDLI